VNGAIDETTYREVIRDLLFRNKSSSTRLYEKIVRCRLVELDRVKIIILLTSQEAVKKISQSLKDFSHHTKYQNMVCVYNDETIGTSISKQVEDIFGSLWQEQRVYVPAWSHLKGFFESVIANPSSRHVLKVPSSSCSMVPVSTECLTNFEKTGVPRNS
jgi:PHP family Zn ribbon phosphoesterase